MPKEPEELIPEEEWKKLLDSYDSDVEARLFKEATTAKRAEPMGRGDPGANRLRTRAELDAQFPEQRRDLICPECKADMVLKDSRNGPFYGCVRWPETRCKGAHSAHRSTGLPMGVPAGASTKKLRQEAHDTFDQLWKTRRMKRSAAYQWLANKMGLPPDLTHIGMFNEEQCRQVIKLVDWELKPPNRFELMDNWGDWGDDKKE